jgi:hypothetical protein
LLGVKAWERGTWSAVPFRYFEKVFLLLAFPERRRAGGFMPGRLAAIAASFQRPWFLALAFVTRLTHKRAP